MKIMMFAAFSLACVVAACDGGKGAPDATDVKLELKSPPALVTSERHTGDFSAGESLSTDAALKPLTAARVKEVKLDTVHKIIEIAPGVRFSAWTFGNQVPGPTIRARVGDKIRFSMTNRSDEPVPGGSAHGGADDALDGLSCRHGGRRAISTSRSHRARRSPLNSR
jgi:nitrite reductase (NO-forming)